MESTDSSELAHDISDQLDAIETFGSDLSEMLQFFDRIGYTDVSTLQKCCYHYTLYHFYYTLSETYKKFGRTDISAELARKSKNERSLYYNMRDDIVSSVSYDPYYLNRYYNTDEQERYTEEELYLGEGSKVTKFPARVINNNFYTLDGSLQIFRSYYYKYYDDVKDLSQEEQNYL